MTPTTPTAPGPGDSPREVTLRPPRPEDVPLLFAFESDPAWGAMAMVKARSQETFEAVWAGLFAGWAAGDTGVLQRTILEGGVVCGTIGCRRSGSAGGGGERDDVGYGLGRAFWGRGIASRALGFLLAQVPRRPLWATAAASNAASIRVLEKHGFVVAERRHAPESDRAPARDEVRLVLRG